MHILVSYGGKQSDGAQAHKGFVQTNLLILLTVRPAATDFETKPFLPSQKQAGGQQKRYSDVDIRALLYSNHEMNSNLWPGSKRQGKNSSQRACCGQKFTGADHLTFKEKKKNTQERSFVY